MTPLICQVCQLPLMSVGDPEVEGQILEIHQRTVHPNVIPWACSSCFYVPPGVEAVRCTDIRDGCICPMWKARPAWLSL